MIEQRVTLRYDAQQIPAIVQAVQGDTGRDVIFELADYEIPAGATANYYIDKPDGNAIYNSAEVISSTEILAHLTEQALAVPGRNNGQVRILSDDEVITSFDFVLEVEAFRGILHLQSETEINIFDAAIQEAVDDAIEEIQEQTPVVTGMQNSIAPTYSSSSTYSVGDYAMYNAQLYRCITAITTAEAWTAAHWVQVPIANDVNDLKSALKETNAYIDWSVSTGKLVRASDGAYVSSAPYNAYEYPVYGLSKLYLTPNFTNATYGYAFYDAAKKFIPESGAAYSVATETEIDIPDGAYYFRFTENTSVTKFVLKADWGLLLTTKAAIKSTMDDSSEMYGDVYANVQYASDQGLAVSGKYYDTSGNLQSSSGFSTSGIVRVPYGAKDVNYYAYKTMSVPTMIFFDEGMNIVGTIVATEAAVYGNLFYSGHATIPATAKYYEVSFNSTAGQTVFLKYSKPDNNNERINLLEADPLSGKKLTCTGDSITAATHSYPGHSYVDQIAQAHGMTVNNKAIWGAVFAQNQVDGKGSPRGCIYDTIALMDADADIVIISGGINDLEYYARAAYWGSITPTYEDELDTETFCGALEGICKTALQKWSGKPIIFVFEHRMTIDSTTYGGFFKNTEYALMIQIFQKWGIPYVDLYHDMPSLALNAGYKEAYTTGDGTHPNIAGYAKFYVPRVYSKIKEVMGL